MHHLLRMFINPLANFTLCFHESCNFRSVQRSLQTVPPQVRRSHDSCLPPITPNPSHASGEYSLERTTSRNHIPSPLAFSQTTISRPSRSRLFLSSSVSKAIPPRTYGEKKNHLISASTPHRTRPPPFSTLTHSPHKLGQTR